jgi:hypothetical protein
MMKKRALFQFRLTAELKEVLLKTALEKGVSATDLLTDFIKSLKAN